MFRKFFKPLETLALLPFLMFAFAMQVQAQIPLVSYQLSTLKVIDKNETSKDEPYLWVYYIIVDDNTWRTERYVFTIQDPGHDNITSRGLSTGDTVNIPPEIGTRLYELKPILGTVGFAALVLMGWEEDNTPNTNVKKAYSKTGDILNDFIRDRVRELNVKAPEKAELKALKGKIESKLEKIYGEAVHWYDPFSWDPDDAVGNAIHFLPIDTSTRHFEFLEFSLKGSGAKYRVTGQVEVIQTWTGAGAYGRGFLVGDFNGDGRDDLLRSVPSLALPIVEVMLSNGKTFSEPRRWLFASDLGRGWYIGDFNGDGKKDIMTFADARGGANVFLSDGSKFFGPQKWITAEARGQWFVADFNGDRKADLMRVAFPAAPAMPFPVGAEVLLSDGSKFGPPQVWTKEAAMGKWYLGDFNRDGRSDVMRASNGKAEVLLSDGGQFLKPQPWLTGMQGSGQLATGDFDGNGTADLMRYPFPGFVGLPGGVGVSLSDGQRFANTQLWLMAGDRGMGFLAGDFNGDHRDDLLRYAQADRRGAEVFLSDGTKFTTVVPAPAAPPLLTETPEGLRPEDVPPPVPPKASRGFALLQNYPNPFNPETWIPFRLAKDAGKVQLRIYDVSGQVIRTLALGHKTAGLHDDREHAAYWDGRNQNGEKVSSGVYFYEMEAGDFSATRKMILMK